MELIQLSGDNKRAQITKSSPSVHNGDQFEIKKVYGKATVPSFYIGPKNSGNKQVPLIVMPHGGPHAVTVDAFVDELAVLLQQGQYFWFYKYLDFNNVYLQHNRIRCAKSKLYW